MGSDFFGGLNQNSASMSFFKMDFNLRTLKIEIKILKIQLYDSNFSNVFRLIADFALHLLAPICIYFLPMRPSEPHVGPLFYGVQSKGNQTELADPARA